MARKIETKRTTEVFINTMGDIVIGQRTVSLDEFDSLVWFEADQIDILISQLQEAKKEREEWKPDPEEQEED